MALSTISSTNTNPKENLFSRTWKIERERWNRIWRGRESEPAFKEQPHTSYDNGALLLSLSLSHILLFRMPFFLLKTICFTKYFTKILQLLFSFSNLSHENGRLAMKKFIIHCIIKNNPHDILFFYIIYTFYLFKWILIFISFILII